MNDTEWFVVTTEHPHGIYRYAVEYWLYPVDGFEGDEAYEKWYNEFKDYFLERTAISERVVAIEQAEFLDAFVMVEEAADNDAPVVRGK